MTAAPQSAGPDWFVPPNRLSRLLHGLDRSRFAEHVSRAQSEINRIAPALAASLHVDIRTLAVLCRGDETAVFQNCRAIGLAALAVVESARLGGRPMLADAAAGLWEMIEALSSRGVWHSEALRLHADSLAALSAMPDEPDEAATILSELRRLRTSVGAATR